MRGFSLIELAVVITIMSVLLTAGLELFGGQSKTGKIQETNSRITEIKTAITNYMLSNTKRMPCAAPLNAAVSHENFGRARDCLLIPSSAANELTVRISDVDEPDIRMGAVPVRELGLDNKYAFDAWGSRFLYVVTEDVVNGIDTDSGGISLIDDSGTEVPDAAIYIVLTHGSDAKGAYNFDGALRKACGSAGGKDEENCDMDDRVFNLASFNDGDIAANWFDDLVGFGTAKSDILGSVTDNLPCYYSSTDGKVHCDADGPTGLLGSCIRPLGNYHMCNAGDFSHLIYLSAPSNAAECQEQCLDDGFECCSYTAQGCFAGDSSSLYSVATSLLKTTYCTVLSPFTQTDACTVTSCHPYDVHACTSFRVDIGVSNECAGVTVDLDAAAGGLLTAYECLQACEAGGYACCERRSDGNCAGSMEASLDYNGLCPSCAVASCTY